MALGRWFYGLIVRTVRRADLVRRSPTGRKAISIAETLGKLSIVFAAGVWLYEYPERIRARDYSAWSLVAASSGKGGEFGRTNALQDLNRDGVSLAGINLNTAILRKAELSGADMENAVFHAVNLEEANFSCSRLQKVINHIFSQTTCAADLSEAEFDTSKLVGTKFTDAYMGKVTIKNGEDYYKVVFHNADLNHARFMDVLITCGDFSAANLSYATFHNARFLPCFDPNNKTTTPPNFTGTRFFEVDLQGTQIEPDWLKSAILCHVTMPDGTKVDSGCTAEQIKAESTKPN